MISAIVVSPLGRHRAICASPDNRICDGLGDKKIDGFFKVSKGTIVRRFKSVRSRILVQPQG